MRSFLQHSCGCFILISLLFSCKEYHRNSSYPNIKTETIRKGEKLAQQHCSSCHLYPDPSLLDLASWEFGVLPNMAPYLGIFQHNFKTYPSAKNDSNLPPDFYPSNPVVSPEEWQHILSFYLATAPDSLAIQSKKIFDTLNRFDVETGSYDATGAAVSYIGIDTTKSELLIFDSQKQELFHYNSNLKRIKRNFIPGNLVDIEKVGLHYMGLDIGIMNPTNTRVGRGLMLKTDSFMDDSLFVEPVFEKLARPVDIQLTDIDGDGDQDYVVCEFGNLTGGVSWMENQGGAFTRRELITQPGAIQVRISDYNGDGRPDLWILFSQGDEAIKLFTNLGKGHFNQQTLLRFPPMNGSSYFEISDFNNDGHPDILYTCGDNADYSMVLKPYHGVYLYMNDGRNKFEEKFFYPINGCFKAMAKDFDGDGDLDIAAIAFFADYQRQPEESFVYLQNENNDRFTPSTFSAAKQGRWLTMDAADLDADGDIDIVLGNFSIRPSVIPSATDWQKGPAFIVLRNQLKSEKK